MTRKRATLHLLCGKIAAGKSTLAAKLATQHGAVLMSEDRFLAELYPAEIVTLEDYIRSTTRLRSAIAPHITEILRHGMSVVLDFQANTPSARRWMREIIEEAGPAHQLHYLEASDTLCKGRLAGRNASGSHEYQVSEAEYDLFTTYFVPPTAEEHFNIVTHRQR
jgi:predicted kinase